LFGLSQTSLACEFVHIIANLVAVLVYLCLQDLTLYTAVAAAAQKGLTAAAAEAEQQQQVAGMLLRLSHVSNRISPNKDC
jgi:hypothetical protein